MTSRRLSGSSFVLAGLFSIAVAGVAGAQAAVPPARIGVSATFGAFWPVDSAMSDVYGSHLVPVTGQIDVRIVRGISLFAGLTWMSADGQSIIVGTPVVNEVSATTLGVTTVRIGAAVSKAVAARWTLVGGAGAAVAGYEETWPDAGLAVNDHSIGFLVLGEARYALRSRWAVIGRVEYSTVRADVSDGNGSVNLGGVVTSAGVRVVF